MTHDTRRLWLRVAIAIVLFACGMRSFAQDTPRSAARSRFHRGCLRSIRPCTRITRSHLKAAQLDYIATAGTLRVRQDKGDAEAAVFYVSYRKDGEDAATRPITFVFNGGPGSSAAWLHLGGLGPRRLALDDDGAVPAPPTRLVDNAQTWLRFTDLVFVDPVGTGFSRAIASGESSSGEVGHHFWGMKSDLRSLAEFIRLYLTSNDRWGSPKYVAGESYGGFRAAVLVDVCLHRRESSSTERFSSRLLSTTTLNLYFDYLSVMPWVTFVPSYAATAFHHGKDRERASRDPEAGHRGSGGRRVAVELLLALAKRSAAQLARGIHGSSGRLAAITGSGRGRSARPYAGRIAA